jgi:TolB protein
MTQARKRFQPLSWLVVVGFVVLSAGAACGGGGERSRVSTPPQGLIAFTADTDEYGHDDLYVINGDGTGLRPVAEDVSHASIGTWSPDGRRIAFSLGDRIEIVDLDTRNRTIVVESPNLPTQPHWSPDGTSLVFVEDPDYGDPCGYIVCNPEIYRVRVDGSGFTRLTNHPGYWDLQPVWSGDGNRIAFYASRPEVFTYEFYSIRSDGSDLVQLTDSNPHGNLVWVPNTDVISYIDDVRNVDSEDPISFELFLVTADGGRPQRLTDQSMDMSILGDFAWSPDGSRLAYVGYGDDLQLDVYTVDSDGTNELQLTEDHSDARSLSWSPDGNHVAFMSDHDGTDEIWVVGADGSNLTRITDMQVELGPMWSPVP